MVFCHYILSKMTNYTGFFFFFLKIRALNISSEIFLRFFCPGLTRPPESLGNLNKMSLASKIEDTNLLQPILHHRPMTIRKLFFCAGPPVFLGLPLVINLDFRPFENSDRL